MADMTLALTAPLSAPAWLGQPEGDVPARIDAALNSKTHRERWKYTKSGPVLALLPLTAAAPDIADLPEGVTLHTLERGAGDAPMQPSISDAPEACSALCYQDQVYGK